MNTTKIMWAWLLNQGDIGEPGFYGTPDGVNRGDSRDSYLNQLQLIGVDWKKTKEPATKRELQFAGTFNEPDFSEFLTGTLILKNGKKQKWYSSDTKLEDFLPLMGKLIELVNSEKIYRD